VFTKWASFEGIRESKKGKKGKNSRVFAFFALLNFLARRIAESKWLE
jgi:hypothetical protein